MSAVILMAFGITAAVLEAERFQAQQRFFANVFYAPQVESTRALAPRLEPRVVCGMTLIPVNPDFDSRIRVTAPSHPEHKIRAIRPPVCAD